VIVVQRRSKIKEILIQEGSVKVSDLVRKFEVSEETIRRDLNQLEREGLIKKNYGGGVLIEELQSAMSSILPVQQRKFQFIKEKDAIGKGAAELVKEGSIIILDAGSTTWCVARNMRQIEKYTVVTNSIDIAQECSQIEGSSIFMIGGKLIKKSMSLVGPQSEFDLQKYNADFVFLGTSGISLRKGFTSSDIYEAEIKRAMISTAQKVVVLADHTKFECQGLISFSNFQDVDILITSDLSDEMMLKEIENQGVKVIVCPTEKGSSNYDESGDKES
jgi:DeoR/GlpR family transcriptional regulator of sugar metabolism